MVIRAQADFSGWTPQDLAWIIPFLFAGLGCVRAGGSLKAFDVYHEYIVKIEEAFSVGMNLGEWEHFLNTQTENEKDKRRTIGASKFACMFWISLDMVTALIALLLASIS